MIQFLHTYSPSPVLSTVGPMTLYWYGFFYAVSIALGYWLVSRTLHKQSQVNDPPRTAYSLQLTAALPDLALALVVVGLIGARLYHVLNELPYYFNHPLDVFAFWRGGLAIHGALIADLIFLWWYSKKLTASSSTAYGLQLTARRVRLKAYGFLLDLLAPAMLLGQAIGRWGNYFNQELFGRPTSLPWGIPIDLAHRPLGFEGYTYFHPTFLYESLWDFVGAIALITWQQYRTGQQSATDDKNLQPIIYQLPPGVLFFTYLVYMALGRLLVEYLRIDTTPIVGLRLPANVSILIIVIGIWGLISLTVQKRSSIL